ncbi:MAG: RNA polymerase sigma factor [Saprospiraceae bacterium]|nr:RNA polymerase sigma factor [Saprospiraceae bacterium]
MTFEQIYHEYKNLVYNLSLQYTNNVHDAEEILQDVFLKVFDHLGEFRSTADMKTWIYRIAVNQSLDFIKSQQRKKRSFLNQLLRIVPNEQAFEISDFNHLGIDFENKEALELLMRKIYKLPENQKTVIILLKIEYLSQKEVASIMQINEGAVESLFQRAKTNLKKVL